jgi:hypothetical protein
MSSLLGFVSLSTSRNCLVRTNRITIKPKTDKSFGWSLISLPPLSALLFVNSASLARLLPQHKTFFFRRLFAPFAAVGSPNLHLQPYSKTGNVPKVSYSANITDTPRTAPFRVCSAILSSIDFTFERECFSNRFHCTIFSGDRCRVSRQKGKSNTESESCDKVCRTS